MINISKLTVPLEASLSKPFTINDKNDFNVGCLLLQIDTLVFLYYEYVTNMVTSKDCS